MLRIVATVALALIPALAGATKPAASYTKEQARDVLRTAEEIRSLDKCEVRVELKTEQDKRATTYDMRILRSTEMRAYIEFLAPDEERGRRMLARGRSYWSTFPDSKRVVSVSRREMIGNSVFAIADLFQIDAEQDYDATIVGAEKLAAADALKLELKAKHDDAPYARIEYWVEAKGYFPLKAAFYGVSGKHLKTMTVEARREIAGRVRPEVTRMQDEVTQGRASWWKTVSMTPADPPDSVFSKDYLKAAR